MNTLDRFVRIIYREQPLSYFLTLEHTVQHSNVGLDRKIATSFQMCNPSFKRRVSELYLSVYPDNYNPDEVDEMLSWIEQNIDKENCNAIDLLIYIVNELLFYQNGEITVSYDDFLEWNGFINKIDQNILYSMFLAVKNISSHNHQNLITHDNYRLKEILAKGMSENHMHLKGSGYTADMNWHFFYSNPMFSYWSIIDFMSENSMLKEPNNALAFDKLRIVRLYLMQLAYPEYILDKHLYLDESDWQKILFSNEDYPIVAMDLSDKTDYLIHSTELINCSSKQLPNRYIVQERQLLQRMFCLYFGGHLSALQTYLLNTYILGLSQFKFLFYQDNINMGFEKFKRNEDKKEFFYLTVPTLIFI